MDAFSSDFPDSKEVCHIRNRMNIPQTTDNLLHRIVDMTSIFHATVRKKGLCFKRL